MKSELLIKDAKQVIAFINGQFSVLEHASVFCSDGIIQWVGPSEAIPREFCRGPFVRTLHAAEQVVLPGLIDAHTHTLFAGSRESEFEMKIQGISYQEIAARGGGIKNTMAATRKASKDELLALGRKRLRKALEFGITTLEIKSGYGLSYNDEIKILEVIQALKNEGPQDIIPTFLGAHTIPPEYRENRRGYIDMIIYELLPYIREKNLAEYCDVFCETNVFTPEETREIFKAAMAHGFKLRLHADQLTNTGGAELAASCQAVAADHLEHISEAGIAALRDAGVVAGLLPGCSFFLRMPYPPARELIDAGVPVALATDFNPGSCMTQNLPLIMSIACTQMRMTPAEAIQGVTCHAARALERDDIGNIRPGMKADLAIFDVPSYAYIPYHFGQNHIVHVIKNGKVVI